MKTRRRARDEWLALKPGAHDGYLRRERFEAIRMMVAGNVPTGRHPQSQLDDLLPWAYAPTELKAVT